MSPVLTVGPAPVLRFAPESLALAENGGISYTVTLSVRPSDDVTVTIASSNADVLVDANPNKTGAQTSLTFTTADWSRGQIVTVTALSDADSGDRLRHPHPCRQRRGLREHHRQRGGRRHRHLH